MRMATVYFHNHQVLDKMKSENMAAALVKFRVWLAGILLCASMSCYKVPVTQRKELNLVPNVMMENMSFTEYSNVLRSSQVVAETDEQSNLVRLVGGNIQHAVEEYMRQNGYAKDLSSYKWEYHLIDSDIKNAWCMPGGKVAVYSGLLSITQNESSLAIVLGHEIAHAIAHHGNERMSEQLLTELGGLTLEEALKNKPQQTQALFLSLYMVGSNLAISLPHSRMQESEADKMGLVFAAMAGYDPEEAIGFWRRMDSAAVSPKIPEFLSTHPSDKTRIKRITEWLPEIKQKYFQPH